jgi:hypothetical protein
MRSNRIRKIIKQKEMGTRRVSKRREASGGQGRERERERERENQRSRMNIQQHLGKRVWKQGN